MNPIWNYPSWVEPNSKVYELSRLDLERFEIRAILKLAKSHAYDFQNLGYSLEINRQMFTFKRYLDHVQVLKFP